MNDSTVQEEVLAAQPRWLHAFDYGLLSGLTVAAAYGLAAELFGLTWGLLAVGFGGGLLIGAAITRGAWGRRRHVTVRRLQVLAAAIGVGSGVVGIFVAYVVSQALFPQATTPLADRVSLAGFTEYFAGLFDTIRVIHAASLAAMAFMAWRGAR